MNRIKRPLAIIGFSFLAASCFTLTVPREYVYILLALFSVFVPIHYFTAKRYTKHLLLVLAVCLISVFYTASYDKAYQFKIDDISTEKQSYTGYVVQKNSMVNPRYYTLQLVDTNNNNRETFSVKIFYTEELDVGDIVTIEGKFSRFKASSFDFTSYFNNIRGNLSVSKLSKADINFESYSYLTLKIKQYLLWKANDLYTAEDVPLVWSMGYSDKTLLPERYVQLFSTAGISHALVVSGFHIMILMGLLNILTLYLPIKKKIKNILVAATVFVFMSILGFSPSIIRAGTIAIIALVLTNFKREPDNITTLGFIALVTVLSSPYAARDIGLLLSYSACLGIIFGSYIAKKKGYQGLKSGLLSTTMTILFMMPVLSFAGMDVTILSPILNILLLPVISVICGLSFFTPIIACLGPIGKILNIIPVFVNSIAIKFLLVTLQMITDFGNFALINVGDTAILVLCLGMAVGVGIGIVQFKNSRAIKIFAVCISLISFLCYNSLNSDIVTITAFDSGREGSYFIHYKSYNTLVLSEYTTVAKLKKRLAFSNKTKYNNIVICAKDNVNTYVIDSIAQLGDTFVNTDFQDSFEDKYMHLLHTQISGANKYIMEIGGVKIGFGHGKVEISKKEALDFYFLGNDKPHSVVADNIFIFGRTPKWMKIDNIQELSSDLVIKINIKTGEYKVVKDVYNFGYQL